MSEHRSAGREETASSDPQRRSRGGRPTRAAAAERDERLIDIATSMFMEQGFEATSMDRLAEAAAIGKATLYARYSDKGALFADVLHRRILAIYEPLIEEVDELAAKADLEETLRRIAYRLVEKALSPDAFKLSRILAAQAPNFPDLARLALQEGYGRHVRLVGSALARFKDDDRYNIGDPSLTADLFLALIMGRTSRLAIYGIEPDPEELTRRTGAALDIFLRGIARR